ncbi:MAG: hypothetical protein HRU24_11960 [Gammaproteobacteria bacterium]|nr:hypothetical protein [Gammaproteobacteria bacterium]
MKRLIILFFLMVSLVIPINNAVAEEIINITKVESATVFNIRRLSEKDLLRDQRHDWRLFSKSLLSGVLGYQYGSGSAMDVKNVLDAVLAHNQKISNANQLLSVEKIKLLEMVVRLPNGVQKTIIIPLQKNQVYRPNDKVRLVHFETGVFIDRVL